MPFYKVSKHELDEIRRHQRHGRARVAALAVSALMLLGTAGLWLRHALRSPGPVVGVPVVKVLEGAAETVAAGAAGR